MSLDWKTWAGVLLLPVIAIGIWFQIERTPVPPLGESFVREGNIIKDNPGLEPGVWYLSYEEPGKPGLTTALYFDHDSRCIRDGVVYVCDMPFEQGEHVRIAGFKKDDVLTVTALTHIRREEGTRIKLYYYKPSLDQGPGGVQCSEKGIVAVERVIPKTNAPLAESIKLLLRGEISQEERAEGITTEFPLEGVSLEKAVIEDGIATLTFRDPQNRTGGGSCFVSILRNQIEATAKQFPTVQNVQFEPEELFQP